LNFRISEGSLVGMGIQVGLYQRGSLVRLVKVGILGMKFKIAFMLLGLLVLAILNNELNGWVVTWELDEDKLYGDELDCEKIELDEINGELGEDGF
jgi:hypothetical protein